MSVVIDTTVGESEIESEVTMPPRLRRFFSDGPFRAEYGVDLSELHPGIAPIPAVSHACPVAWANGVDVRVPVLDGTYLDSLRTVRDVLVEMYPEFMEGGAVAADTVVDVGAERPTARSDDSCLLFTGGVDSFASYVRNREASPTLVCVRGWVIDVDDERQWSGARGHVEAFAEAHGLETRYVRSNMLSWLDGPLLQAHYKRFVDGDWYSSVGHGLGLLGLCAPLSDVSGFGTVHIASSYTEEFSEPWGSHPAIDENVRWGRTRCNHDAYDLTRQEKIERIAEYATAEDGRFRLRTCLNSATGDNCNDCEKCYRTMCGLVLAGLDPNEFGYEMAPGTFDTLRQRLRNGAFVFDEHTTFYWRDLQNHVDLDGEFPIRGAREFFEWLAAVDIDAVAASSTPPAHHSLVRGVARHLPRPVYSILYPVYKSLARHAR